MEYLLREAGRIGISLQKAVGKVWLGELVGNPYLVAALSAWALAQVVKTLLYWALNRHLDIRRLFGDGGMPSGHSATVSALAAMCAIADGSGSVEFAVSAVLAVIVCHDAMGVRRETGKQAQALNRLLKAFEPGNQPDLKELVGHTPLQVVAGILLGIGNTLVLGNYLL